MKKAFITSCLKINELIIHVLAMQQVASVAKSFLAMTNYLGWDCRPPGADGKYSHYDRHGEEERRSHLRIYTPYTFFKKLFLTIVLVVLALFYCNAAIDTCKKNNSAFTTGESLTYVFSYHWGALWLSAGEATMTVEATTFDNKPCYHIMGLGVTYPSYDWFYKVHDKYETYIDTETLLPYKFIRNVNEGSFKIYNNVSFDQDAGKATSTHGTYTVPACIQDVISAIYYLRNTDMSKVQINQTIPITIFLDDSVYHLYVRYVGKEKVKTDYGEISCYKIKPLTIKGTIFTGGEDMVVYISNDANKIPVLITSPITIGEIRADLSVAKGLSHPLNGKMHH